MPPAATTRRKARLRFGAGGIVLLCSIIALCFQHVQYSMAMSKIWSSSSSIADSAVATAPVLLTERQQRMPQIVRATMNSVVARKIIKQGAVVTAITLGSTSSNDPRLPRRPTKRVTTPADRILVVYSGPTQLVNRTVVENPESNILERKTELYRVNFEHFLRYGVQCKTQDTVLVVTKEVEEYYRAQVDAMHQECMERYNHPVILAIRNNTCLDLETVRRVMHDSDIVDIGSYDYFVYANCGMSGPSRQWADLPWTDLFIAKLSDQVKMSGITINCRGPVHVQSMVYALDRVSIGIIRNSTAIFDCVEFPPSDGAKESHHIINRYERGMSQIILEKGFGIASIIKPTVLVAANTSDCKADVNYKDQWMTKQMMSDYGRILDLEDTVFFKTSRLMSEATKKEINFTLTVNWTW